LIIDGDPALILIAATKDAAIAALGNRENGTLEPGCREMRN
jgi:hypothetical protein